jgi:exo-beta-1,3-glucanase (GH17 family)
MDQAHQNPSHSVILLKIAATAFVASVLGFATINSDAQNASYYTNTFMPFEGLCYSGYRTNENPNVAGSYPTISEMTYDLTNVIRFMAPEIRTYGLSGTLSSVPGLCYSNNIGCYPCAWVNIGFNGTNYFLFPDGTNEINELIEIGNMGFRTTKGLIVGSESILNTTDPNLVATLNYWISYVRTNLKINVPVTTAETWDNMLEWPQLASNLDFIGVHIDPWWYNIPPSNAVSFVFNSYESVVRAYPGKRVVIMETGMPSAGTYSLPSEANSVASVESQTEFLVGLNSMLATNHIECLYFEPFDELWPDRGNTNDIQDNWGIYFSDRSKKPSLRNYLQSSFGVEAPAFGSNSLTLTVSTFERNPYTLYEWSDLLDWDYTPTLRFTGASGANHTFVTITNSAKGTHFYRAEQGF